LSLDDDEIVRRIRRDLTDSDDEEYERELEDRNLDQMSESPVDTESQAYRDSRKLYFRELFRMQGELVKLQDWVVKTGQKIVILFEGRDAAGKGGVIKRITQRLNPRVCRVAALPAPNLREQTQWYFQRYVAHLPGAGEMVLFDRSWYNRAGVERVMGFCTDEQYEEFFRSVPEFEKIQEESPTQLHPPFTESDSLRGSGIYPHRSATASTQGRLRAPAGARRDSGARDLLRIWMQETARQMA
jgi:polyphosphate kinase